MANPKYFSSSLALIALLVIATTSSANSQATTLPGGIPMPRSVAILGVVTCSISPPVPRPPIVVNVTLSCDGGLTAVVPPVTTNVDSLFLISVPSSTATIVDPTNCAVFVTTPVAGCRVLNTGEVLRAPIVALNPILPPLLGFVRLLTTLVFSVATIA